MKCFNSPLNSFVKKFCIYSGFVVYRFIDKNQNSEFQNTKNFGGQRRKQTQNMLMLGVVFVTYHSL